MLIYICRSVLSYISQLTIYYSNQFILLVLILFGSNLQANCIASNADDLLQKIKENHPRIVENIIKKDVYTESIEVAKQRPNPEFNIEGLSGDTTDGNVFRGSLSLEHVIELGGKRDARVEASKQASVAMNLQTEHENQGELISVILQLYRLRQTYELIPIYAEALSTFNKILYKLNRRSSLSPSEQVEKETLVLAVSDYKLKKLQLENQRENINRYLSYYIGSECDVKAEMLPYKINLDEKFSINNSTENYSKLKLAKANIKLAKSNLNIAKSNSYPNIRIGPAYEYEKMNFAENHMYGLTLTFDLPILSLNSAGRSKARKELRLSELNLSNTEKESQLDKRFWKEKYQTYAEMLKNIPDKKVIEKKHQRIESLFRRGAVSTALVIETHRQLIEFTNTRFNFENEAVEALWNMYKINGTFNDKRINFKTGE